MPLLCPGFSAGTLSSYTLWLEEPEVLGGNPALKFCPLSPHTHNYCAPFTVATDPSAVLVLPHSAAALILLPLRLPLLLCAASGAAPSVHVAFPGLLLLLTGGRMGTTIPLVPVNEGAVWRLRTLVYPPSSKLVHFLFA